MVCNCNAFCQPRLHIGMAASNFHSWGHSQCSQYSSSSVTDKLLTDHRSSRMNSAEKQNPCYRWCVWMRSSSNNPQGPWLLEVPLLLLLVQPSHISTPRGLSWLCDPFNFVLMLFQERHLFSFHRWLGFVFLNCTKYLPLLDRKEIAHSLFSTKSYLSHFFKTLQWGFFSKFSVSYHCL